MNYETISTTWDRPWESGEVGWVFIMPVLKDERHDWYGSIDKNDWDRTHVRRGIQVCRQGYGYHDLIANLDLEILRPEFTGQIVHWESFTMIELKWKLWWRYETDGNKIIYRLGGGHYNGEQILLKSRVK